MSEAEIVQFLESLPDSMSTYDKCLALASEAQLQGDLYTAWEARKSAMSLKRAPDTVKLREEQ